MGKRTPPARKQRTREHIIADLAVNHVERQVFLAGDTVDRTTHDYGIDLILNTYDANGLFEAGHIRIQVKATEVAKVHRSGMSIPFQIDRRDLLTWLDELVPVILIFYEASADVAFWLHIQGYFAAKKGFNRLRATRTVTVQIPAHQLLDVEAIRTFARLRDEIAKRLRSEDSTP